MESHPNTVTSHPKRHKSGSLWKAVVAAADIRAAVLAELLARLNKSGVTPEGKSDQ